MTLLQNIWWYLVLIGVMILVHELGHYWAARLFDRQGGNIQFPGLVQGCSGFRRGETDFRFSAILFGGYVKMAGDYVNSGGEQSIEQSAADPRSLYAKPRWQRMVIAFAGPAINIILAVVLLAGLFMVHYSKMPTPAAPDSEGFVTPDGAAAKSRRDGRRSGSSIGWYRSIPPGKMLRTEEIGSPCKPFEVWVNRKGEKAPPHNHPCLRRAHRRRIRGLGAGNLTMSKWPR